MLYTFLTECPSEDPIILFKFEKYPYPLPMAIDSCAYETAIPMSWKEMLGHKSHEYGGTRLEGIDDDVKPGLFGQILKGKPKQNAYVHFENGIMSEPDENDKLWVCDSKFKILLTNSLDRFQFGIIGRCFIDKFWEGFHLDRVKTGWTASFKGKAQKQSIQAGRQTTGTQKLIKA